MKVHNYYLRTIYIFRLLSVWVAVAAFISQFIQTETNILPRNAILLIIIETQKANKGIGHDPFGQIQVFSLRPKRHGTVLELLSSDSTPL